MIVLSGHGKICDGRIRLQVRKELNWRLGRSFSGATGGKVPWRSR